MFYHDIDIRYSIQYFYQYTDTFSLTNTDI